MVGIPFKRKASQDVQFPGAQQDQMRPVAVVTDSACDISPDQAQEWGVSVVPLTVTFPDGQYKDVVELTPHQFYEKLIENDEIPVTSQPSPQAFLEAFSQVLDAGCDVVCVTISSNLSGTYQSACIARDLLEPEQLERVHVVDSLNLCAGQLVLVREAARLANQGMTAPFVADALEGLRARVRLVGLFDGLKYLQKGGRISALVGIAGTLLNIKPVLAPDKTGKLVLLGKARGSKNGRAMLEKTVRGYGGVDYAYPIQFAYSGLSDDLLQKYLTDNKDMYAACADGPCINCAGATIGTHAGPGAIAVAFVSKK